MFDTPGANSRAAPRREVTTPAAEQQQQQYLNSSSSDGAEIAASKCKQKYSTRCCGQLCNGTLQFADSGSDRQAWTLGTISACLS